MLNMDNEVVALSGSEEAEFSENASKISDVSDGELDQMLNSQSKFVEMAGELPATSKTMLAPMIEPLGEPEPEIPSFATRVEFHEAPFRGSVARPTTAGSARVESVRPEAAEPTHPHPEPPKPSAGLAELVEELRARLESENKRCEELESRLSAQTAQLRAVEDRAAEERAASQAESLSLRERLARLSAENSVLEEKLALREARADADRSAAQSAAYAFERRISALEEELRTRVEQIEKFREHTTAIERSAEQREASSQAEAYKQVLALESAERRLEAAAAEIAEHRRALASRTAALEEAEKEASQLREALFKAQLQASALKRQSEDPPEARLNEADRQMLSLVKGKLASRLLESEREIHDAPPAVDINSQLKESFDQFQRRMRQNQPAPVSGYGSGPNPGSTAGYNSGSNPAYNSGFNNGSTPAIASARIQNPSYGLPEVLTTSIHATALRNQPNPAPVEPPAPPVRRGKFEIPASEALPNKFAGHLEIDNSKLAGRSRPNRSAIRGSAAPEPIASVHEDPIEAIGSQRLPGQKAPEPPSNFKSGRQKTLHEIEVEALQSKIDAAVDSKKVLDAEFQRLNLSRIKSGMMLNKKREVEEEALRLGKEISTLKNQLRILKFDSY